MQATTTLQRLNGTVAGAAQREQRSFVQNAIGQQRMNFSLGIPEGVPIRDDESRMLRNKMAMRKGIMNFIG